MRASLVLTIAVTSTASACSDATFPTHQVPFEGYAIMVDVARDQVVLVGTLTGIGVNSVATDPRSTWLWRNGGWTTHEGEGPAPRHWPALAYDAARDVGVLFGGKVFGFDGAEPPCSPSTRLAGQVWCGDTWLWDGHWTKVEGEGPPPDGFAAGSLAFVPPMFATLYAGHDGTWIWDGAAWSRLGPGVDDGSGGEPHIRHSAYYNPVLDEVSTVGGQPFGRPDLTWEGDHWREQAREPVGGVMGAAFDIADGHAVLLAARGTFYRPGGDRWSVMRSKAKYPGPWPADDMINRVVYDPRHSLVVFGAQRTDCVEERYGCTALYSFDGYDVRLLE